jgi:hydroxymethylpyrimidine pyrophosphatase-like HAD family hydrolase
VSKSLPHFLEFAQDGVTKGAGMDFLAERLGFTKEQTVAFGDGENDVELVEWPAFGVAVANAHERVKAVARWVCPPAEDEGVAQVLEALLDSKP